MNKNKLLIWILVMVLLVSSVRGLLTDGLIHAYTFDTADMVGPKLGDLVGGINGTNFGTDTNQPGKIEESWDFVKTNTDYVLLDSNICAFILDDFTWVGWINIGSLQDDQRAFSCGDGGTFGFDIWFESGNDLSMLMDHPGTVNIADKETNTNWANDAWNQAIITWDNSTSTPVIYSNNVSQTLLVGGGGTGIGAAETRFGVRTDEQAATWFNGNIDGVLIYNRIISAAERAELFRNGVGWDYHNFTIPPPVPGDTLNLSNPLPTNNTIFNNVPIGFNLTVNASNPFNCSLVINGTINQTQNGISNGTDVPVLFNVSPIDGFYSYSIDCVDNVTTDNTSTFLFSVDATDPQFITNYVNNTIGYINTITSQFNFTDNILLNTINITLDGTILFNRTNISSASFQANISINMSDLSVGKHNLTVFVADGHTAKKLKNPEAYNPTNGIFNDYVEYRIDNPYKKTDIKIYLKDNSIFDSWKYTEKIDRFSETVKPHNKKSTQRIIVESDEPIYIITDPLGRYGGQWIITGEQWKDFVLKDEPNTQVSIKKINDYKVEVTISGIQNTDELTFNSIGDLNVVTTTFDLYKLNLTDIHEELIIAGQNTILNLSVDFGQLDFSLVGVEANAKLEWNGTNFTATQIRFNSTEALFSRTIPTLRGFGSIPALNHTWFFNMSNSSNIFTLNPDQSNFLVTPSENQTLLDVVVAPCNATVPFNILNISYFDEITDARIDVTNSYLLNITDGTVLYNQVGSFTGSTNDSFCTNVNPIIHDLDFTATGSLTLSKSTYITRLFDYPLGGELSFSNDPTFNLSLFLIPIANSSTIKYNWLTTDFLLIDGTMRISKCNPDGSKSLVESTPVINGVASANIELLTQAYSYDIIIDGEVFVDNSAWTRCHIETSAPVAGLTFFVAVDPSNVGQLIGLSAIDCTLTRFNSSAIQMIWEANAQDDTYVAGCVEVIRNTLVGSTRLLKNCSVEADGFSRIVDIPVDGNEMVVLGSLQQSPFEVACGNQIVFNGSDGIGGTFGLTGLLAAVFLITAMALIYGTDGPLSVFGTIIGTITAWIFGIINFPWVTVSAIVILGIIVAMVGRYSRQRTE